MCGGTEFVNKEFIKAGLVVDEKRPLKVGSAGA